MAEANAEADRVADMGGERPRVLGGVAADGAVGLDDRGPAGGRSAGAPVAGGQRDLRLVLPGRQARRCPAQTRLI